MLSYRFIVLLGVERFMYYDATNLGISNVTFHLLIFILCYQFYLFFTR